MAKSPKYKPVEFDGIYADWFLQDNEGARKEWAQICRAEVKKDKPYLDLRQKFNQKFFDWRKKLEAEKERFVAKMGDSKFVTTSIKETVVNELHGILWENFQTINRLENKIKNLEEKRNKTHKAHAEATGIPANIYSNGFFELDDKSYIAQLNSAFKAKKQTKENLDSGRHKGPEALKEKAAKADKAIDDYMKGLFEQPTGRGWRMNNTEIFDEIVKAGGLKWRNGDNGKQYTQSTLKSKVENAIRVAKKKYK